MDKAEYKKEMVSVSEASLGLQMVQHIERCASCRKLLEDANKIVVAHVQKDPQFI